MPFHHAAGSEFAGSFGKADAVLLFNSAKIDSRKLPQAKEEFFFECQRWHNRIYRFDGAFSFRNRGHISSGIVTIGPALRATERMCARAKPEIRLAPPVFQIVARFKSRL